MSRQGSTINDSEVESVLAAEQVDVFFGDTSNVASHIYVRFNGSDDVTLSGYVEGPFCEYSQTLPARIELRATGTGKDAVASAILPDPCFWTPELPFVYKVAVVVDVAEGDAMKVDRQIGVRPLGAAGANLLYAARRYVMRIVDVAAVPKAANDLDTMIALCRETGTALLVKALDESLADLASRHGVPLLVRVDGQDERAVCRELKRLAEWPAVAIAVLSAHETLSTQIADCAPNLLLAAQVDSLAGNDVPSWVHIQLCERDCFTSVDTAINALSHPTMAITRIPPAGVAEARVCCDGLQRELAPRADLAGYIASCDNGAL